MKKVNLSAWIRATLREAAGMSDEMTYKGWTLDWTGWKARFTHVDNPGGKDCDQCGRVLVHGDLVKLSQGSKLVICAACDGQPNYVVGQWVAGKEHGTEFFEVCAGHKAGPFVHEFRKGEDFPVEFAPEFTTDTPDSLLEEERARALACLKAFLDREG